MKKLLCLTLIVTLTAVQVLPCWSQSTGEVPTNGTGTAPSSGMCSEQGFEDGRHAPTGGAFTIGLVSGFGLGLIGTALAWAFQGEPAAPAPTLNRLDDAECRVAYREAYGEQGKKKKRGAALTGGLIGTAILVAVVAASSGSSK